MPMPPEYRFASRVFEAYTDDLRARIDTHSRNIAYMTTQAVFVVFRKRLSAVQGLMFSDALPAVPQTIFVHRWRPEPHVVPFGTRDEMTREVQAFRRAHNSAPGTAIEDLA